MSVATTTDALWALLEEVKDPEVPVISVVELGVLRNIELAAETINITITPTYSGCPAMQVMEDDMRACLAKHGYEKVNFTTVLSPAWTTDWLTDSAKEKLREYGIAPPEQATSDKSFLTGQPKSVTCPNCGSRNTAMLSQFGSTACKALYKCSDCLEPFDYFKCL